MTFRNIVGKSHPSRTRTRVNATAIRIAAHSHTDAGTDRIVCLLCGETYRAITYTHLKQIHGFEGAHPIRDYKERFGLRVASCEEVCERAKEVQVARHTRAGRHWTEARILRAIRALSGTAHGLAHSRVPMALSLVAARRFGSWETAVRRAGIDPVPHRLARGWDGARVVAEARRLAQGRERLSSSTVERIAPELHRAAIRHFGGWSATLKAAGLDPAAHREPSAWSGDRVEAWIRQTHAAGGDIRSSAAPSGAVGRVIQRGEFRWSEYVETLGIPYPGPKQRLDWTDAAVLAAIRQRRRRGLALNAKALVRDSGSALVLQARKRFGSWDGALRKAGFDPDRIRLAHPWTRKRVVVAIRDRSRAGKSLRRRDVVAEDPRLVKAAARYFPASWTKAVTAAGLSDGRPRGDPGSSAGKRRR